MTPERFERIVQVLKRRQPDLTVITDEVHKGRNLSAMLRSCDAVGVDEIHCVIPRNGFRAYRGTASGSQKWVSVVHHEQVEDPVIALRGQGFQVVAAHLSEQAVDYRQIDYTQPTAILMGAERDGLSEVAGNLATQHIIIPMLGMSESLNVSVACAAILLEAQRQRELAGMYNEQRLTPQQFASRLFQWAHPTVAEYCDQRRLTYPSLREDGELADGPGWYRQIRE